MVSILSFDTRCIEALLHDKNERFFNLKYPMFYKLNDNRERLQNHQLQDIKYFKSAIDIAFFNNQLPGLNKILAFIIKYQNNFMHSYLFKDNLIQLLLQNVNVVPLMESNILMMQFSNEEWP